MAGIFRQKALDRLESPEQTDQILLVTSARGWLVLAALGLLLIAVVAWGVHGRIATTVQGNGMLLRSGGVFSINSPADGNITIIDIKPNDVLTTGQLVGRIDRADAVRLLETGLKQVEELQVRMDDAFQRHASETSLLEDNNRQQRHNLQAANNMLETELARLHQRLAGEQRLAQEGLISGQQVFVTNQQIHQIQINRSRNNEGISALDRAKADLQATQKIQIADLKFQLINAQDQVQNLRNRLEQSTRIISQFSGRVVDVLVKTHDSVNPGTPIALVELSGPDIKELEGVFFFPPGVGKELKPGMEALVAPAIVKPEKYGYLRAIITDVSPYPVSAQEIDAIFRNPATTQMMMVGGAPFQVQVDLFPDASAPSGYRWTSPTGPPQRLLPGTPGIIKVVTQKEPPISLVLPFLKSFFLGV